MSKISAAPKEMKMVGETSSNFIKALEVTGGNKATTKKQKKLRWRVVNEQTCFVSKLSACHLSSFFGHFFLLLNLAFLKCDSL